jgi:hypothetical protein
MTVSGVLSSSILNYQNIQSRFQQFQQEFQQLGTDLQSGNLPAAQADFASLQQGAQSDSSAQSSNPFAQVFNQLSQDLQSGNLTGAQQDYAALQEDIQNQATQTHHHHHRHGGGGQNTISQFQLMSQLGTALQAGNLTAAQQAYSALQQDLRQPGQDRNAASPAVSGKVSVSA